MKIPLHLRIDTDGISTEARVLQLLTLVEALVCMDSVYLKACPNTPPIYDVTTLRLAHEDVWSDIPNVMRTSRCCEVDLAAWRIAELRAAGTRDVSPHITMSDAVCRVRVRCGDLIEDPAAILFGKKG